MLKVLTFGLGFGAAVQAFRQWPADGPVTVDAAAVVFVLGLAAAFFGGRAARRAGFGPVAVASAEATATAAATGNAVQVFVGSGVAQGGAVGSVRMPTEAAPWMGAAPVLSGGQVADLLEGHDDADLAALLEHDVDVSEAR